MKVTFLLSIFFLASSWRALAGDLSAEPIELPPLATDELLAAPLPQPRSKFPSINDALLAIEKEDNISLIEVDYEYIKNIEKLKHILSYHIIAHHSLLAGKAKKIALMKDVLEKLLGSEGLLLREPQYEGLSQDVWEIFSDYDTLNSLIKRDAFDQYLAFDEIPQFFKQMIKEGLNASAGDECRYSRQKKAIDAMLREKIDHSKKIPETYKRLPAGENRALLIKAQLNSSESFLKFFTEYEELLREIRKERLCLWAALSELGCTDFDQKCREASENEQNFIEALKRELNQLERDTPKDTLKPSPRTKKSREHKSPSPKPKKETISEDTGSNESVTSEGQPSPHKDKRKTSKAAKDKLKKS